MDNMSTKKIVACSVIYLKHSDAFLSLIENEPNYDGDEPTYSLELEWDIAGTGEIIGRTVVPKVDLDGLTKFCRQVLNEL
jgi:hypothetical protein